MIQGINYLESLKNKEFYPPYAMDSPGEAFGASVEEWHSYPIKNYSYKFNSWGFRDVDFEQYLGKPVIIALGDSFTLNIGGPREDSWCYQLQSSTNLPILNFGVNGIGNDGIKLIYEQVIKLFDVKHTFIVYSFFHRRLVNGELIQNFNASIEENIKYFEKNFIDYTAYSFLPYWCWSLEEKKYITKNHKLPIKEIWNNLFKSPLPNRNRDNFHLSYSAHTIYKKYFEKYL